MLTSVAACRTGAKSQMPIQVHSFTSATRGKARLACQSNGGMDPSRSPSITPLENASLYLLVQPCIAL